jgi:hypothetical protein
MSIKRTTLAIVIIILFLANSSYSQKSKIDPEFQKFWTNFQTAVQQGDKEKVADMVIFPLKNQIMENETLNRNEFIKYFDILFIDNKNNYKKLNIKNVFGKDGDFTYEETMDGRTDLAFNFNKNSKNDYKLTSIHIPGYDTNADGWKATFEETYKIILRFEPQRKFEKFLNEFKTALKKGDKNKIADMIQYPNNSFLSNKECSTNNKENFIKCFDVIFDKKLIAAFKYSKFDENTIKTKKSEFNELNKGDTEYLIFAYPGSIEIGFYFTKINGKILLFKSEFFGDTN